MVVKASYYQKEEGEVVRCLLCPHHCRIQPTKRGLCGVRENREGTLYSLVFGKAVAAHIDPVEKKPFFHYLPGSLTFSIATVGCNLSCRFCQNSEISQEVKKDGVVNGFDLPPEEIVRLAKEHDCRSISYTYTEPAVFFEYAYQTAILAKKNGLDNNFVTNGYLESQPLKDIAPYLTAANIDLKGFREDYYRRVCGGKLQPVLDTLILMKRLNIWLEVTTLIIPGQNDDIAELTALARFIKEELGPDTPWHISRFFPHYLMDNLPPTPPETIEQARAIGFKAGLYYVYSGNLPGAGSENTFCPKCGKILIGRSGFTITEYHLKGNRCAFCGMVIAGLFPDEKAVR